VSALRCSGCREKRPGKYAAFYWAWFNADRSRSAWKQRFCAPCALANWQPLLLTLNSVNSDSDDYACVSCGASAQQDSDPVYLTLYVPGKDPQEYSITLDAACAASLRVKMQNGAERLPDRGGVVRGPSSHASDWDELSPVPA
jgi:hypothetical protein